MPLALTPSNIQAGFRKTGIYTYNRHLFTDELDFDPALVTDRPNPENTTEAEVVPIRNTEDETPPLSLSHLTNDQPVETVAQQQGINIRKVHQSQELNRNTLFEGSENLNTPPRRRSSIKYSANFA